MSETEGNRYYDEKRRLKRDTPPTRIKISQVHGMYYELQIHSSNSLDLTVWSL